MKAATQTNEAAVGLPTINLTDQRTPPADAKVRIISRRGKTLSAIIIPASWHTPPHVIKALPEPQDEAGRNLERQLRAIGLTNFEFHDYQNGEHHVRSPS